MEQETGGVETGEGLGREWRMGARDWGSRDRGRIGKGVENGSMSLGSRDRERIGKGGENGSERQEGWRQGKNWEGSGEWEQETGGVETGEGLGREWRMGA